MNCHLQVSVQMLIVNGVLGMLIVNDLSRGYWVFSNIHVYLVFVFFLSSPHWMKNLLLYVSFEKYPSNVQNLIHFSCSFDTQFSYKVWFLKHSALQWFSSNIFFQLRYLWCYYSSKWCYYSFLRDTKLLNSHLLIFWIRSLFKKFVSQK